MDQSEHAEQEPESQSEEQKLRAAAFETPLRGIVSVVYGDAGKDFGYILRDDEQYYYDPRLLASEARPARGDTVFFIAKPPLKAGGKPIAAAVPVKGKHAVGTIVNMLPSGRAGFVQVADERGHRFNLYMGLTEAIAEAQVGERFRFVASENRRGPSAIRPERVE